MTESANPTEHAFRLLKAESPINKQKHKLNAAAVPILMEGDCISWGSQVSKPVAVLQWHIAWNGFLFKNNSIFNNHWNYI